MSFFPLSNYVGGGGGEGEGDGNDLEIYNSLEKLDLHSIDLLYYLPNDFNRALWWELEKDKVSLAIPRYNAMAVAVFDNIYAKYSLLPPTSPRFLCMHTCASFRGKGVKQKAKYFFFSLFFFSFLFFFNTLHYRWSRQLG